LQQSPGALLAKLFIEGRAILSRLQPQLAELVDINRAHSPTLAAHRYWVLNAMSHHDEIEAIAALDHLDARLAWIVLPKYRRPLTRVSAWDAQLARTQTKSPP